MRVVIAGGGIAALEVLAGLRALASDRTEATLLAPVKAFSYRPLSTAVPFTFREERTRSLAELAGDLGARFVHDGLAYVDANRKRVLTHDGDFLPYDALVVAVGARAARGPSAGMAWRRDSQGMAALAQLLRAIENATVRSVAFVVPRDVAWAIDAYELSLIARLAARRADVKANVLLVTAERNPAEALGPAASEAVRDELARAGIEFVSGVEVQASGGNHDPGGDALTSMIARLSRSRRETSGQRVVLPLEGGSDLTVDRAVSLPAVRGPGVPGMAHDAAGFIPVDASARTADGSGIYAAGDATALALKHSTLASGQATAAAEAIAAEAGARVTATPWSAVLYGLLALPPRYPGAGGSPWLDGGEPATNCIWWPPGHVAGRYLAPYLARRDPEVTLGLDWHPEGLPVAVPVAHPTEAEATATVRAPSEDEVRHDAMTRQLMAIRREERDGERLGRDLERRLAEFERHEQEVIRRLEAAGYLRHAGPA